MTPPPVSTSSPRAARRNGRRWFVLGLVMLLLLGMLGLVAWRMRTTQPLPPSRLTLAPMVGGLDACLQNTPGFALPASCEGREGSAASLIEATLSGLGMVESPDLTMGYTLKAPLFDFLRQEGQSWRVDTDAVRRLANTIRDVPRPVVLYLFSTHFESSAPIEKILATDAANLAAGPHGPLPLDSYFGSKLYPWSIATTKNELSQRRQEVIEAITTELCQQPAQVRERILGVTLLGEVHQLFPKFETGMGFTSPYEISDYSETSRQGFRQYLSNRFGDIAKLNTELGASFAHWEDIAPPSRNIRTEALQHYWQHIDAFAHGKVPVSGWIAPAPTGKAKQGVVKIYLNGELLSKAPVGLGRQDVLEAEPTLGTADVGWRQDLDFSKLPAGIHQVDMYLDRADTPLLHLGTRRISIMDRRQSTPLPIPVKPLPKAQEAGESLRYYIDSPVDTSSYFFNPLARLWHAYRNTQVVDYLQHFNRIVRKSCLAERPIYTHQLIPFSNPSWDANKYAVDDSLQPLPDLKLGVSLYGEPTYGSSFVDWLRGTRHTSYGVTEFHPLKALTPSELSHTLNQHRLRGAQFVSMFLEARVDGNLASTAHNIFSFDPDNTRFGSNTLYTSLKAVLANKKPLAQAPPSSN